jgi:branched-chain amino acid transport system substrate-binding protein
MPMRRVLPLLCLFGMLISSCSNLVPAQEPANPVIATLKSPAQIDNPSNQPTTLPTPKSINGRVFKIGLLLPLTGPLAFLGEGYQMGINLALKESNNKISGIPVEVLPVDTFGTPEGTIKAATALIQNEKVNLIIGPGTSPEALAAIPVIDAGQTPMIDATSTSPLLFGKMGKNGSQWVFRIIGDEKILAKAFATQITKDYKSVAIISEDSPFQKEVASEYISLFKDAGMKITLEEHIPVTNGEFRPLLFRTRQSRPDALFLVMSDTSCAILMRQYKVSYTTIPVYSRGGCTTNLFNRITQDDKSIGENITEAVLFSELQDPKLAGKFQKEYGQPLTGHRMAGYYAAKYVVIPALKSLVETGKPVSQDNIRKSIVAVRTDTPIGKLNFDTYNQAYLNAVLLTNQDGKPTIISSLPLK